MLKFKSVKDLISKEVKFGIKNFKNLSGFGNKIDKIKFNVIGNIKKIKEDKKSKSLVTEHQLKPQQH